MRKFAGFLGNEALNDSGVVENVDFHCFGRSVWMIILHILGTNSFFIVSRSLLSLYYQVNLTWFSGRRLTASMFMKTTK